MAYKLLYSITILLCSCDLSGNDPNEQALFEKVKNGMTEQEVIAILGKPDTVMYSFDSLSHNFSYFAKGKNGMRSTMPVVVFDSTNRVSFATYGNPG
ncbi:MAG: outer membrane protein assembly factor BamE [Bacteroidota bacterium]